MEDLYKIEGVEIFASGTWNGDKYTTKDLDDMVTAFAETSKTVKPYLKLGHSNEQSILQNDGFPAAGWIGNVYRDGEKLLADFIDIPAKIFELLKNKAYRKVSSEIYHNITLSGKPYRRLLSAVALLGSDMPAVTSLDDILSLYGLNVDSDSLKVYNDNIECKKVYNFIDDNGGQTMQKEYTKEEMEAKIDEVKAEIESEKITEIENLKEESETIKVDFSKAQEELEELRKFKAEAEREKIELELAKENAENEKFIIENDIPVSAKEFALAILREDKKEYSFGEENFSKRDLLKKYTDLIKETSSVNFDENSLEGENPEKEDIEEKIETYMNENKCTYTEAYKAVYKADEEEINEDQGE